MTTVRPERPAPRAQQDPEKEHGTRRYWGSFEPPTSKAEFFSAVTAPTADRDATTATIRMYGPIDSWGGWWGISTEDVAHVLDALPDTVDQIVLRINSPGGEVWEAMAILNMLGAHHARVIAVVDGLAASAASFIAAGCEETVMSPGSQMMIHSPSSIAWGNAAEMRKTAAFLDKLEESIVEVYAEKAGDNDWPTLLTEETWMTAADAVEIGLADRIAVVPDSGPAATVGDDPEVIVLADDEPEDAATTARIQAAAASARATAPRPPSSTEPGNPIRKEPVVANDDPQAGAQERLGTTETDVEVEAAPAAAAAELPETAIPAPNAALPEGFIAVDQNLWRQTQDNARMGAEARAAQDRTRREGIIATALAEGRIASASRDAVRAQLEKDEAGTVAFLATVPKNTVPVEELGHQAVASDDASPAHWKR